MIEEIKTLIKQYSLWLEDNTTLRQINDWVEITTPYLDRHNDYLQIYANKKNDKYLLTDDGYIINDLELSGCSLEKGKRYDMLITTLNGFGVKLVDDKRLEVTTISRDFALKKHNLIQAMMAVNDLFYLAEPKIVSLFLEDVSAWLNNNNIRYTPRVNFKGKSGYDHHFDFVIPKSESQPERIMQTINNPTKDSITLFVFEWIDTKDVRPMESKAFAMLNDQEKALSVPIKEALKNYDVTPIPWSERERTKPLLAA